MAPNEYIGIIDQGWEPRPINDETWDFNEDIVETWFTYLIELGMDIIHGDQEIYNIMHEFFYRITSVESYQIESYIITAGLPELTMSHIYSRFIRMYRLRKGLNGFEEEIQKKILEHILLRICDIHPGITKEKALVKYITRFLNKFINPEYDDFYKCIDIQYMDLYDWIRMINGETTIAITIVNRFLRIQESL